MIYLVNASINKCILRLRHTGLKTGGTQFVSTAAIAAPEFRHNRERLGASEQPVEKRIEKVTRRVTFETGC